MSFNIDELRGMYPKISLTEFRNEINDRIKSQVLEKVRKDGLALGRLPSKFRNDREIVLAAVEQNGLALEFAGDSLKADQEIVEAAVWRKGLALQFAAPALQGNKKIVLRAVASNGLALQFAAPALKADQEVVLAAVRNNALAWEFAADTLKKDNSFLYKVIVANPQILERLLSQVFSSPNKPDAQYLQAIKEFILAAVKENIGVLNFVGELKKDPDFMLAAIKINPYAVNFADSSLKQNPDFMRKASNNNQTASTEMPGSSRKENEQLAAATATAATSSSVAENPAMDDKKSNFQADDSSKKSTSPDSAPSSFLIPETIDKLIKKGFPQEDMEKIVSKIREGSHGIDQDSVNWGADGISLPKTEKINNPLQVESFSIDNFSDELSLQFLEEFTARANALTPGKFEFSFSPENGYRLTVRGGLTAEEKRYFEQSNIKIKLDLTPNIDNKNTPESPLNSKSKIKSKPESAPSIPESSPISG